MTASAPPGLTADLRDRYQLLDVIGRGGMATVYKAHDVKHDRTVALKVLHDDLAASLGPERFKREILIAARLQHPHILSVFDSGETSGRLWFTMPYVQGESLRDLLRREGKLPVETALLIVREAAQALTYAHKQGVIHRDIKPENILLTEDGSTLVADFGIARAVGDGSFEQGLTQTGSAIGTPAYMAPEQATGETVLDERVDQYALAAVLYELLTGAPPFTGVNAAALIAARYSSTITPVHMKRSDISGEIDAAVQRALSLKPVERFPTVSDFARAVSAGVTTPLPFANVAHPHAPVATMTRRRRASRLVLGSVVLLAAAAAAMRWRSATPNGPATSAGAIRIAVLPFQNLGDSADAYFADGMTDELRGKLVGLPGLQVIARASSAKYTNSDKTPEQIAEELEVRYLLAGTLRYERGADGGSTVRIQPELMEVGGDGPATTRWQGTFNARLTDAPVLQVRIAEQVAGQLRITLGTTERLRIAALPTENPDAYDAYLHARSGVDDTPAGRRRRIADLERAVGLDSTFADAWQALAQEYAAIYWYVSATPEYAQQAKDAATRARAVSPGGRADHAAWAAYHRFVTYDLPLAERELRAAIALAPDEASMLSGLAFLLDEQTHPDDARPLFERALKLDPLNSKIWSDYGVSLLRQRRYTDAEVALNRAALLAPASVNVVHDLVMLHISKGDLARAQATIREAYRRFPPLAVDSYIAIYRELGWALDAEAQLRLIAAPASAFDNEIGTQFFVRAQILRARGDLEGSRAAARQALPGMAELGAAQPNDLQWPYLSALTAALAGQAAEAEALVERSLLKEHSGSEPLTGRMYYAELRARIYVLTGKYDRALDELATTLAQPSYLGRGNLALDPMWAPLRSLPRYQRIMATASAQEIR